MNRTCSIVQDLFPVYSEELETEASRELIQNHLPECSDCRAAYEKFCREKNFACQQEQLKSKRLYRALRRVRYQAIGMVVGAIAVIIFFITYPLLYMGFNALLGKQATRIHLLPTVTNVKKYGDFKWYNGYSPLLLFPDKEAVEGDAVSYIYDVRKYPRAVYQIMLECHYSPEEYASEKERLLSVTSEQTGKGTIYLEDSADVPAVYAVFAENGCWEYVLLFEEEYRMVYVYLQGDVFGIDRRQLEFDENYLPYEYGQTGIDLDEVEAYTIYPPYDRS